MIDVARFVQLELFIEDDMSLYPNTALLLLDSSKCNPMTDQYGTTWSFSTCGECQYLVGSRCQKNRQKHCSEWEACGLIKLKI
ncbi:hypothetical protein [Thermoactinomyces sp. DSM 45892]|uniref:hypothetical protein n=1 Tax=Thermoactinomyces sp. DSM 45892 TaxID=1882753 RepID=UPI0008944AFF|nr:hypothetical protein [Thermoactinomyces sp. DSM 45892]SDY88237.1 hypothetical protein SAMN05444416_109159 [Thermoactinomyces sp. DSM 45892]